MKQFFSIVALLALFAGCKPAVQPDAALNVSKTGSPDLIAKDLKAGASVNARDLNGDTPLLLAAYKNTDPEAIKVIIKAGAEIDIRNNFGETPLMLAAAGNSNPEVVLALLGAGADPKAKSKKGWTAFNYIKGNKNMANTAAYTAVQKAQ